MGRHSIVEAKNKLSELIERARKGEEITITSHGEPVAMLSAISRAPRRLTPAAIKWLKENQVGTVMPKEDASALVSRMRDEDWER